MSSIQPPLPIPQTSVPGGPKSRPMHSVAGPQERKLQGKGGRNRNKAKSKGPVVEPTASDESGRQSSDSESSSSSASEVSLSRWAELDDSDRPCKGKGWDRGKRGVSSSEGEVSDSDTGSAKFKTVLTKIRHQALSCLALVFQVSSMCIVKLYPDCLSIKTACFTLCKETIGNQCDFYGAPHFDLGPNLCVQVTVGRALISNLPMTSL